MKIYISKCLFIESNEVSNDTVMIRLQKDTYSRDFLLRLISGAKHISIIFHFLSPCPKLVAKNTVPNQECLWTRECKSPQQIWTQLGHKLFPWLLSKKLHLQLQHLLPQNLAWLKFHALKTTTWKRPSTILGCLVAWNQKDSEGDSDYEFDMDRWSEN